MTPCLRQQRGILTKVCQVIAHVEEDSRLVAVHHLDLLSVVRIKLITAVDGLHHRCHLVDLLAVDHGNGAARIILGISVAEGVGIVLVVVVEPVADTVIVASQQVAADRGVGHTVAHHLGRRGNQVVGNLLQIIRHLDGRHITVVEEDIVGMSERLLYGFSQAAHLGLITAVAGTAEEACHRHMAPFAHNLAVSKCTQVGSLGQPTQSMTAHYQSV